VIAVKVFLMVSTSDLAYFEVTSGHLSLLEVRWTSGHLSLLEVRWGQLVSIRSSLLRSNGC